MDAAFYPGSFNPLPYGHLNIIERSLDLFAEVTVLVAVHPQKKPLFPLEENLEMIREAVEPWPQVPPGAYRAARHLQGTASAAPGARLPVAPGVWVWLSQRRAVLGRGVHVTSHGDSHQARALEPWVSTSGLGPGVVICLAKVRQQRALCASRRA